MKEEANEELLKTADDLLNRPDKEIMALALGKNYKHFENYLTATNIKLRSSVISLEQNIKELKKSMDISSVIMILLTIILVILTCILVKKSYVL
jgi:hypothetical protein